MGEGGSWEISANMGIELSEIGGGGGEEEEEEERTDEGEGRREIKHPYLEGWGTTSFANDFLDS